MDDKTNNNAEELKQQLAQLDDHSTEYINTAIELARALFRTEPQQCISVAQRTIALANSADYQDGIARAYTIMGHAHTSLSNYDLARDAALKAIPIFEKLEDHHGLLDARNLLGISYNTSGQFDKALSIFLANIQISREYGDDVMLSRSLNNSACILHDQGNYADALEYYLRTYQCARISGSDREMGIALINIAVTHIELGNHKEAFGYLMKSVDKISDVPEIHARAMHNLSRYYQGMGNLPKALEYARMSLQAFQDIQNTHGIIETESNLGEVFLLLDQTDEAEACFLRAIVLAQSKNEATGVAHNQLLLGRLHRMTGKINLAISELESVIALHANYKTYTYEAHLELSLAHEGKGDYKKALQHYKKYTDIRNQVQITRAEQRMESIRRGFQLEQVERETALLRKKNAELAEANQKLRDLTLIQKKLDAQKSRLVKQLEAYAHTDVLTGLFNRRYLNKRFALEFQQARDHQTPLCVLIGDLDNFKQINDQYSHETGDLVLTEVARLITSNIREQDVLSRYGGEEFVLLMPGTNLDDAIHICTRLNRVIAEHDWQSLQAGLKVTISIGLSCNTRIPDHETMLALADEKLYVAKRQGKNRLCY